MTTTPKRAKPWFIRIGYVGSVIVVGTIAVTGGILGAHVYRWEVIIWAVITLAWIFSWSYALEQVKVWREIARMLGNQGRPSHDVVLIKPEDIE